jgi:bifunctional polynucleotide phosphatase/kinase
LSNQGGLNLESKATKIETRRLADFKQKVSVVLSHLDLPISIYAATAKDGFRKPRMGMWFELLDDHELEMNSDIDLAHSIFVGDAGGRQVSTSTGATKDHSCVDRYGFTLCFL